ncbi:hypothetical protein B0H14DRAFT_3179403 [Mycena olivaceomarginata]|nr:hypothetical protein B0H14DRAFT_3179403 [Mycena olivaceomarginata]
MRPAPPSSLPSVLLGTFSNLTANVPYLGAITGTISKLIEIRTAMKSNKERASALLDKIGTITTAIAKGLLCLDDTQRGTAADVLKEEIWRSITRYWCTAACILSEWTSQGIMKRAWKYGDFGGIADSLEKKD